MSAPSVELIRHGRLRRIRRRRTAVLALAVLLAGLFLTSLCVGHTLYRPDEVLRVVLGERREQLGPGHGVSEPGGAGSPWPARPTLYGSPEWEQGPSTST
ncbi:hypothetical protein ACLMMR_42730, partial [Streptomyces sp. NPDC000405]